MTKCFDDDKKVASGYPIKLYHATTDKKGICDVGIQPSSKIKTRALGQLNTEGVETISFTVDKDIAVDIAKDLQTAINIMNKKITPLNISNKLNKTDDEYIKYENKEGYGGRLVKVKDKSIDPDGEFYEFDGKPELFYDMAKGKKYYRQIMMKPSKIWNIISILNKDKLDDLISKYKSNTETEEDVVQFFRIWSDSYLSNRENQGGRHNPIFSISANPKSLIGLYSKNVGLYEYTGYFPSKCIDIGRYNYICSNKKWKKNDYDVEYPKLNTIEMEDKYYKRGEDENKEIKVSRKLIGDAKSVQIKRIIPKKYIKVPRYE